VRALVTGGAGFIGHHLVQGLLQLGHEVAVLDDFSSGSAERLSRLPGRISLVEGSVLDADAVDRAIAGTEVVFHLAAIASVARSLDEPRLTHAVNVDGTIAVVLAAARHRLRRAILAGSSAVYGDAVTLPCREEQQLAPRSPYGVDKLAAEHYLHVLGAASGVETIALRYFNVFGPGQDPASEYAAVIPRFITAALRGQRPTINGSGTISRDFVHVDDVVAANVLAATVPGVGGLTCNIARGAPTTLDQLVAAVGAATGVALEPVYGPPRVGDIVASWADVSRAREILGYAPAVPFETGIARTAASFRAQALA
jgi:UDP-glucose 4-epimerase